MNTITCANCRQINPATQQFCSNCGQALSTGQNQSNFNQNQPNFNQSNFNQPNFNQPNSNAAPPKKKWGTGKILLLVGGLISVVGIGVVLIFVFGFGYLVTQTLQYKIIGKWKENKTGILYEYDWSKRLTVTVPGVAPVQATYDVMDEENIKITVLNKTETDHITISGDLMTTSNAVGTATYTKVK
jgi:hypothetical protein